MEASFSVIAVIVFLAMIYIALRIPSFRKNPAVWWVGYTVGLFVAVGLCWLWLKCLWLAIVWIWKGVLAWLSAN